ncbi:pentapeptide repeat-containing protein, partial [Parvularcula marina]|uniref:pentapeptide repeat-containing protein n=1 Tax=Parvularcula marina TaxID=2292771 RepID=UPI0035164335
MPFAYQDLTDPERELADAVRDGTICVFPEPTEIRGEVIHDLFLGLIEGYEPTHQGLRFAGLPAEKGKSRCLTITGTLDLDYARADHGGALPRLAILNAVFENSFDMVGAHLAEVNLTGCRLHGLRGEQARIDRHFLFIGVETQAPVFLSAAFIEGQFSANGAAFSNPNDVALNFQDATIKGGVVLREANFTGAVVANTLSTEGQFSANGATFSNPNGDALNLQGATVKDGVFLEKANCTGTVEAKGLSTEGQFSANGATFSNPDGIALDLQGATIKNGVFLDAANFTGAVNANTLSTEGQFSANGVTFLNPDGIALILQGATVKGGLFLRKSGGTRATFLGTLDANNALLEYVLAEGAILQGPGNQPAMDFRNASILQDLLLIGAQITGGLALDHATIGARMTITRAIFTPDGHQTCLSLRRATINGTLETLYFASPPTGIFDLTGADIHTIEDHAFRGWPNDGGLILDGLTYRRIGFPGVPKGAPAYLFRDILDKNGPDALFERRRQWLMRQY